MTYYFDMDGTLANFYGVDGWLDYILEENTKPYEIAIPLISPKKFAKWANELKKEGVNFGIISWTARGGSKDYNKRVRKAKIDWLNKYFPNIFTEIHIVKYGTPKHYVTKEKNGILFDDEENNRKKWIGTAYSEKVLSEII